MERLNTVQIAISSVYVGVGCFSQIDYTQFSILRRMLAGIGLHNNVNSLQRDFKSGMERYVQKQTSATVRCFEKAVSLNNKHCYIVEKVCDLIY